METVVVCEDDPITRSTISAMCEQAGLRVMAEVDSGRDAVELTSRFGVDILLLDLGLGEGISGKDTLEALQKVSPFPAVVVCTAYATNPDELIRLGAREVVEKSDLDRLTVVLEKLAKEQPADGPAPARGEERRHGGRPVTCPPDLWRSPSGVSSAADLPQTLATTEEGDAIIALAVGGLEQLAGEAGRLLADDIRLSIARALRGTLRVQDVIHEAVELQGFVVVLRGGTESAPSVVWTRLLAELDADDLPGHVVGASSRVDPLGPRDALARALGAALGASADARRLISA